MEPINYVERARSYVSDVYNESRPTPVERTADDFYVVWFCKTLQNWKVLVSTDIEDDIYYEVTHNGVKDETYVDTYVKIDNVVIPYGQSR